MHHDPHAHHGRPLVHALDQAAAVAADDLAHHDARVRTGPAERLGGPRERREVGRRLCAAASELSGSEQPQQGRDDPADRHQREQEHRAGAAIRRIASHREGPAQATGGSFARTSSRPHGVVLARADA